MYNPKIKMDTRISRILLLLALIWPCVSMDLDLVDPELGIKERWMSRHKKRYEENNMCNFSHAHDAYDIFRRFYAILPYFDKERSNTVFLHKFRGTVYNMMTAQEKLDREAAYYAATLTPLIFLQNYRDTWCLLERFHRALRLYQISHPTEKRSALKLLQNLRAVNNKIQSFISELPGPRPITQKTTVTDDILEADVLQDKKEIRYVKELIKNLG